MILQYILRIKEKFKDSFFKKTESASSAAFSMKRKESEEEIALKAIERLIINIDQRIAEVNEKKRTRKKRKNIDFRINLLSGGVSEPKIFKGRGKVRITKLTTLQRKRDKETINKLTNKQR